MSFDSAAVAALWRYPVKSMLGESCAQATVTARGVKGDRLYAVCNTEGKLGSGKNTRRFRHIDGLFRYQARYVGEVPEIHLPDGTRVRGDEPAVHDVLSNALGQRVTLVREADIAHFDDAPIHLLTTASLAWLQAALPQARIDARRFRPNLLLAVPGATQIERGWIGRTIAVGDEVKLFVTGMVERCGMVTFAQAELPEDAGILRYITRESGLQFGVYAQVLTPGQIRRRDAIVIE